MRNFSLKTLSVIGLAIATLSSCNSMKNLDKDYYSVTPNPLEVHGGQVKVNLNGNFPAKTFKKNVALDLVPELRFEGGNTEFKKLELQGEEYPGNATVVPYEQGKAITYDDVVDYTPAMENAELYVKISGKKGDNVKEFEAIKIADGVITTSLLVQDAPLASMAQSDYTQTTQHEMKGMVNFTVNSSYIRSSELRDQDYKDILALIKSAGKEEKLTITNVSFHGYASPEGEATLNADLSDNRAKKVESRIEKAVKRAKIQYQDGFLVIEGKGADWDGVYAAIKESKIEDKDMILRSLDDQPLLDSKEATLKSLSNTYDELKNDILPQLRRTQIVVSYDLVGKTDEEIKALAAMTVEELKVEMTKADGKTHYQIDANELIYAASLTDSKEERVAIMKKGMELYPADYRFATNAGHCSQMLGNNEEAIALFNQAYQVEENDITTNNLGVAKMLAGDVAGANEMFAKSTTSEAAYNRGVESIKAGKYNEAIENMKGKNTFNLALAKLLNGNYDGAIKTLDAAELDGCMANYVRAIASVRLGNVDDAKNFLAAAFEKKPELEEKAKNDLEFRAIYAAPATEEAAE
jgi:Flp pilus assembly protein TadD/outer membrane protein OmpA-like peptidoglycan-associated protein